MVGWGQPGDRLGPQGDSLARVSLATGEDRLSTVSVFPDLSILMCEPDWNSEGNSVTKSSRAHCIFCIPMLPTSDFPGLALVACEAG